MKPQVGEPTRMSTGPNDAMPSARGAPCCTRQRSRTDSIWRIVSSRSPVGRRSIARTSSGPVPRMHTHLVPPNSTPASSLAEGAMSARRLRRGGGLAQACDPGVCLGEETVMVRCRGGVRRDLLTDREHHALDLLEVHRVDQRIVVSRCDAETFEDPE